MRLRAIFYDFFHMHADRKRFVRNLIFNSFQFFSADKIDDEWQKIITRIDHWLLCIRC